MFTPGVSLWTTRQRQSAGAVDPMQEAGKTRRELLDEINLGVPVSETESDDNASLSLREKFCQAAAEAGMSSAQMCEAWTPVADAMDESATHWTQAERLRRIDLVSGSEAHFQLCLQELERSEKQLHTAKKMALQLIDAMPDFRNQGPANASESVTKEPAAPNAEQTTPIAQPSAPIGKRSQFEIKFDSWIAQIEQVLSRFMPKVELPGLSRQTSSSKASKHTSTPVSEARVQRPHLLDRLNDLRDEFRDRATAPGIGLSSDEMSRRWQPVFTAQNRSGENWLEASNILRRDKQAGGAFSYKHEADELVLLADRELKEAIKYAEALIATLPSPQPVSNFDEEVPVGALLAGACGVPGYDKQKANTSSRQGDGP